MERREWWPQLVVLIYLCSVNARQHHRHITATAWTPSYPCPGDEVIDVFVLINSRGFVNDNQETIWRQLDLVWHSSNIKDTDQVALYDSDPSVSTSLEPLAIINAADYPDGFFTTDITVNKFNFSESPLVSQCLGYYTAYIRDGDVAATNCLRSQPRWMEENADILKDFNLHEIMIPGTHDSVSYHDYEGKKTDENLFLRYASAQEETIYDQFFLGTRYFDTRVAYYPGTQQKFWANHGFVRFRPYKDIIQDLVLMLENTNEIVIFEVGGFDGEFNLYPEAYQELLDLVLPQLERWMAPVPTSADNPNHHVLLSDLWASDRRLLLVWDSHRPENSTSLWSTIPNTWHNDNKPEDLFHTVETNLQDAPRPYLWAVAGEMTDHEEDIIFDRLTGLRDMADTVNKNISRMYRYSYWDRPNIAMSDFFMSTYNVDTALQVNWQRKHCK